MPYTKKQLEERFNIGRSTVYKRLKDCGLDTNRDEYSDEEVENIFKVACEMMQEGHSQEDVRRRFGVGETKKNNTASPPLNSNINNNGHAATNITEIISRKTKDFLDEEIGKAIEEAIPFIPYMIEQKLFEYIQSGSLNQAFANYEENHIKHLNKFYSNSTYTEQENRALLSNDTNVEFTDDPDDED